MRHFYFASWKRFFLLTYFCRFYMSLSWDFEVIARNLDRLPRDCKAYVLLSTGALNPVHIGHVEMMERAAQIQTNHS